MSDGGKGDKRRPEDKDHWDNGYDRIWGNKKKVDESEDKPTRNNEETQEVLQYK
jgi:hypothetical protein